MHTALTIAGSDSGGGAGIQADLKTFAALGVYGTSAITAITAQNTLGVTAWEAVSVPMVVAQIEAVVSDIGADAVKTGMLATTPIVLAVASTIRALGLRHLVVDPVMIAKGGDRLLESSAIDAIRRDLLPLATVVTPNLPEAEELSGIQIGSLDDMRAAGRRILELGPGVVLVKGGHLPGHESVDIACSADGDDEFRSPRIESTHTHGTGCTLASSIASRLALGDSVPDAVTAAKAYVTGAIAGGFALGAGIGPTDHGWALRR